MSDERRSAGFNPGPCKLQASAVLNSSVVAMGFTVDGPTFQLIDTVEKWNKIYGSAASEGMLHSALACNLS